jgi:uncharacterized membrane protein
MHSEADRNLGENQGGAAKKDGYVVAVAVALLVVTVLLAAYLITMRPPSNATMTISVLDSNKQASNYPSLLLLNQNNTFTVWVEVDNHMGSSRSFQVLVKIADGSTYPTNAINTNPVESYSGSLEEGGKWEKQATLSLNETGSYFVVFELWTLDPASGALQFTYKCVLPMEVAA